MTKRAPDQSDPGWYRHSYLLDTTHSRCTTCGETSTHSTMWLVKAHMSYTPLTSLTSRQPLTSGLLGEGPLDSRLPVYQVEHDAISPLCHHCFDPEAQTAVGHDNQLIKSTESGWKEALAADARRRRANATINATSLEKKAETHQRVAKLLDSI